MNHIFSFSLISRLNLKPVLWKSSSSICSFLNSLPVFLSIAIISYWELFIVILIPYLISGVQKTAQLYKNPNITKRRCFSIWSKNGKKGEKIYNPTLENTTIQFFSKVVLLTILLFYVLRMESQICSLINISDRFTSKTINIFNFCPTEQTFFPTELYTVWQFENWVKW